MSKVPLQRRRIGSPAHGTDPERRKNDFWAPIVLGPIVGCVVLLDFDMPGINGMELLTNIKRRDGSVNVIVLTGLISQATALTAMRRGALACLFKPVNDIQQLLDAIHVAFDNTNRWWDTLKKLSDLRRKEQTTAPNQPTPTVALDA